MRWWLALSRRRKAAAIVFALGVSSLVALFASLPDVRPLATERPKTTTMIELRRQQAAERKKPFKLRWDWRPLARISPYLQHAVVFAEDDKFWQHEGVDWEAMKLAAEHDWHERTVERGASTIAQQLAKNLFLSPSRNPIRKLREICIARRLDRQLGKPRVLELYLNIAEWGDGIFGAEAASRRWFGCSAARAAPVQAARLAAALPNPFKRNPKVKSRALTRKAARLVRGMHRAGLIDDAAYEAAERELGIGPPEAAPAIPEPPPAADEPSEPVEPTPARARQNERRAARRRRRRSELVRAAQVRRHALMRLDRARRRARHRTAAVAGRAAAVVDAARRCSPSPTTRSWCSDCHRRRTTRRSCRSRTACAASDIGSYFGLWSMPCTPYMVLEAVPLIVVEPRRQRRHLRPAPACCSSD